MMKSNRDQLLDLIATNSFRLGSFTLSSGLKSDYYIDCRTTTLHALGAELTGRVFLELHSDVAFELQLSEAVSLERLGRRAEQEGRTDDTPEAIRTRLRLYHEQTEPLVEYYRARGILVGIDADRSVEEIFAEIQKALETVAVRS